MARWPRDTHFPFLLSLSLSLSLRPTLSPSNESEKPAERVRACLPRTHALWLLLRRNHIYDSYGCSDSRGALRRPNVRSSKGPSAKMPSHCPTPTHFREIDLLFARQRKIANFSTTRTSGWVLRRKFNDERINVKRSFCFALRTFFVPQDPPLSPPRFPRSGRCGVNRLAFRNFLKLRTARRPHRAGRERISTEFLERLVNHFATLYSVTRKIIHRRRG